MTFNINQIKKIVRVNKITVIIILAGCLTAMAQKPTPTPTPANQPTTIGGYEVTSSVEFGVRGLSVNGDDNKFRSDFNYKPGFRTFDSSFLLENKENKGKLFDSLLVTTTGWSADPTGFVRVNLEKTGLYRFDSKVRRVTYFNNLANHALNEHTANTRHNFGDFDLTMLPENENLRVRLGYSFNKTNGSGSFTTRAYSDEFPVASNVEIDSSDVRAGIEGKLLGFNLSFLQGYRRFKNDTNYFLSAPNAGNTTTNSARLTTFQRDYPILGETFYTTFSAQRTFAKKLDFTGRFVYSGTTTKFYVNERITGRDNSNNIVDLDEFRIYGDSKRPQGRGDLGLTYRITDNFRISNTFTYDQFSISGGNVLFEAFNRRNAAGTTTLATVFTNTLAHRVTAYRRTMNTIEADYQINNRLGFNIGYRFTDRRVIVEGLDRTLPATTAPTLIDEEFENRTNTVIAGAKIKPTKNWSIYADVEHGGADNVFTRLSNYEFTNFRVRNRLSFNKFSLNVSAITKDNNNPSRSIETPQLDFTANVKTRIFSANIDWSPVQNFSFSSGYTYQQLTAETNIIVPVGGVRLQGLSQFFMRDNYAFFDVSAQPFKRVSLFASYRISKDTGQGDRVSALAQNIISSYPFHLQSPEVRLAIRLTKNIDWNLGYQYYNYRERTAIAQNYNAHLPYTSLRIYFGGNDRR